MEKFMGIGFVKITIDQQQSTKEIQSFIAMKISIEMFYYMKKKKHMQSNKDKTLNIKKKR